MLSMVKKSEYSVYYHNKMCWCLLFQKGFAETFFSAENFTNTYSLLYSSCPREMVPRLASIHLSAEQLDWFVAQEMSQAF